MLADVTGRAVGDALVVARNDESPELVKADSLKRQAIGALKSGDFDETEQLLEQALELRPDDRALRQMEEWVDRFQEQRDRIAAERQEAFERQVADVRLLQEEGYRSYAITAANIAHSLLSKPEQAEFVQEEWVRDLIEESEQLGEQYEANGEWLRAMRVWGDLASIEELNPTWKQRLKDATRRVRLLATYSPTVLEDLRDSTLAEREAVEELLSDARKEAKADDEQSPTTQPSTRPSEQADVGDVTGGLDEAFKTDWRDALSGITMTMLRNALDDARENYVRPVEFRDILIGGIDAAMAVATTPGLERTFGGLTDEAAKQRFVNSLEEQREMILGLDASRIDRETAAMLLRSISVANSRTVELPEEVLVSEFADGSLSVLDPFTAMIWPSQVAEFKKGTQGEFVGVGIQIRSEDSGDLRVVSPLPGGPAQESGIKYGDVITHIDGKSAHGISDTQAVEVITGEPGTPVTLTIKSMDGEVKDHTLTRRSISVSSVKGWTQQGGDSWDWLIDDDAGIAYVRLTNFQSSTAAELASAVEQIKRQGGSAIILDLRYNPGGLLQSAVEVADRFLEGGTVVSTRGERTGAREASLRAQRQSSDVRLPMVVLVNEYSASASEIVSGALKDLDRALIVGKRTFGKGSVQMLYRLGGRGDDEAWLKLTTSKYFLPGGESIHKEEFDTDGWGVEPDVTVEMTPQQMRDAISARQAMDVLRHDGTTATVKLNGSEEEVDAQEVLMETDAQLSAALLLLRMQLAGERVL